MGNRTLWAQRLVALFLLGWLLFSYPLLALVDGRGEVFGIPVLFAYLFGAWALLIILMIWVIEGSGR